MVYAAIRSALAVRLRITAHSASSAKEPTICIIMRPAGVVAAALAHAGDVFELAFLQRGNALGADHAAVGDDADVPTLKRARNRSTTGNRVVRSAVLPGHSSQHSGLPS